MDDATTATSARASWQALGTSVELLVTDRCELAMARELVEAELNAIDLACSRFREDSELARVNSHAGRVLTVKDPLLIEAVQVALRAAVLTDGDVEPALGVALELTGYDRDWALLEHITTEHEQSRCSSVKEHTRRRIRASVRAGWQAIELDPERATIKIPLGVKLDLGATAKAWAADRASRAVHERTNCGVLVSLGGDIATAGPSPKGGWRVHVTDDHRDGPGAPGQTISIAGGGLATSSIVARRWCHEGHAMHHIIDPRSGLPARGMWRTASVVAIDCTDANIAATATLVRGAHAPEWLAEHGLPARLVSRDGEVLTVGDWPESRG